MGVSSACFIDSDMEALAYVATMGAACVKLRLLVAVEAGKLGHTYKQVGDDLNERILEAPETYDTQEKIARHIREELKKVASKEAGTGLTNPDRRTPASETIKSNPEEANEAAGLKRPCSQKFQCVQNELKRSLGGGGTPGLSVPIQDRCRRIPRLSTLVWRKRMSIIAATGGY